MKKLILSSLVIALVGIGFVACKKSNVTNNPVQNQSELQFDKEFSIASDNRMLIFKTTADYEKIVSNSSQEIKNSLVAKVRSLNLKSLAEKLISQKSLDSFGDNFLPELLNEDGIVQIGDYLYKIDMVNKKAYVLPSANISEYSDLVAVNKSNPNIRVFTTEDDVIELAESGALSTTKSCGGINGDTYPCYANTYQGDIITTLAGGVVWRLNPGVKHFAGAIYFRLSSLHEIWAFSSASATSNGNQVTNTNGLFTVEIFCKGPEGWYKKRPCGSGDIGTRPSGFYYSSTLSSEQRTFYDGSRNLNGYYFFVQGRVRYSPTSVSVAGNYGGRNINSPY